MILSKAVTPDEMREIEKELIERLGMPALLLMENAARGAAETIIRENAPCTALVFCGMGNNGGDGFAIARHLVTSGFNVKVYIAGAPEQVKGDAGTNLDILVRLGLKPVYLDERTNIAEIFTPDEKCIILDALLGTGLSRNVDGLLEGVISAINGSGHKVYAVDIPSGIDGKNGHIMGTAVKADTTVTFHEAKIGHLLYPGREYTGKLVIKNLGIKGLEDKANREALFPDNTGKVLCQRDPDANKSFSGRVAVIAGSEGLAGAGELCVRAALRCGAGMVTAGVPDALMQVYQAKFTEAMTYALPSRDGKICIEALPAINSLFSGKTAAAIGPGLGKSEDLQELIIKIMEGCNIPLVIDADGLNNLAPAAECLKKRKAPTIVTPHPIEMARLMHAEPKTVLDAPLEAAERFAKDHGVIVALKCGTNIACAPDGRTTFCLSGNAGMATGGSGDVLTGAILALLGSGMDAYDAARYGCHINGLAGDAAAKVTGMKGMLPSDTVENLPHIINQLTI